MLYGYMSLKSFTCEAECPYVGLRTEAKRLEPFRYEIFASQLSELYRAITESTRSKTAWTIAAGSYRSQQASAGYETKVSIYANALQEGIRVASPNLNAAVEDIRKYEIEVEQLSVALHGVCQTGPQLRKVRQRHTQTGVSEYTVRCGQPNTGQELMRKYERQVGSTVLPTYFFKASRLEQKVVDRLIQLPVRDRNEEITLELIHNLENVHVAQRDPTVVEGTVAHLRKTIDDPLLIELPDQS